MPAPALSKLRGNCTLYYGYGDKRYDDYCHDCKGEPPMLEGFGMHPVEFVGFVGAANVVRQYRFCSKHMHERYCDGPCDDPFHMAAVKKMEVAA